MKGVVVFTRSGERVPYFTDTIITEDARHEFDRLGYRDGREWHVAFVAERWGSRHWRLWQFENPTRILGSISAGTHVRWARAIVHPIRRWPTLAAIEMKLRHLHV